MAQQQTSRFSRSGASQRSLRRLTVPSLSMSLRSRRVERPSVTLGLPQLERYHDRAEKTLTEAITASSSLGQDVDLSKWKCLRSCHGVRLFRGYSSVNEKVPLLCIGLLRGSFKDIMDGIYCQTTEEMLLMNAIKCPRLAESAVLYTVQRQTMCEPYAFTGIKWITLKLSVASNREFCYFDKMGLVRQTSGKQMAYHIMHSVDLPEHCHKAKRVDASLCYLFEELDNDLVRVYMQGNIDQSSLSYFTTPTVSDLLLTVTNAMECTRAKKLAVMMATTPPIYRRRSSRRCCDVCRGHTSFFETLQECAGCSFKAVCKKCRLKENVLARDTSTVHLIRTEFCRVCISKMDTMSIDELRAEAGDFPMLVQRKQNSIAAFCKVEEEPEDVDIPGSDRSLTAFTLKVSAQLHDLNNRISSLSMEKVSISEDEDDEALLCESRDVLKSIEKMSSQVICGDKDPADSSRYSSRSTTSTVSSSHYPEEEDEEQYRTSLFARLLQVSSQAEATFHLAQEQSLIAHSLYQRVHHKRSR